MSKRGDYYLCGVRDVTREVSVRVFSVFSVRPQVYVSVAP